LKAIIVRAPGGLDLIERVELPDPGAPELKRFRALLADHTINYRHDPDWGARVREWTHGSGVDHVIEVGGPGTLPNP
jgi:threonine dehydrogenase-like Zn-dependent dehydrogenase